MNYKNIKLNSLWIFLYSVLLVFIQWIISGWSPDKLISGYDAISGYLPYFANLGHLELTGLNSLIYSKDMLGGYSLIGHMPTPILFYAMAKILSPSTCYNLLVYLYQVSLGYAIIKIVHFLFQKKISSDTKLKLSNISILLISILFFEFVCFSPVIGWRVTHGHLNFIMSITAFFMLISYHLDTTSEKQISIGEKIYYFVMIVTALSYSGTQILIGFALFIPSYLLWFHRVSGKKIINKGILQFLFFVIFFVLLNLYPTITALLNHEPARSLSSIIYSYGTFEWRHLLSSLISYTTLFLQSSDQYYLFHEQYYPFGIVLTLACIYYIVKKMKIAEAVLFLAIVIFIVLITHHTPTPFWEGFNNFPLFSGFRVPARLLISLWGISILFLLELSSEFFLSSNKLIKYVSIIAVVISMVLSTSEYFRIQPELLSTDKFLQYPFQAGLNLNKSSLEKFKINIVIPEFQGNTALFFGIPSLDGLYFHNNYFVKFISSLIGKEIPATYATWSFSQDSQLSTLLQNIFNITRTVEFKNGMTVLSGEDNSVKGSFHFFDKIIFNEYQYKSKFSTDLIRSPQVLNDMYLEQDSFVKYQNFPTCKFSDLKTESFSSSLCIKNISVANCLFGLNTGFSKKLKISAGDIFLINDIMTGVFIPAGKVACIDAPWF
jgi:hypothetical protein